jgi:hypothetical protein
MFGTLHCRNMYLFLHSCYNESCALSGSIPFIIYSKRKRGYFQILLQTQNSDSVYHAMGGESQYGELLRALGIYIACCQVLCQLTVPQVVREFPQFSVESVVSFTVSTRHSHLSVCCSKAVFGTAYHVIGACAR